MLRVFFGSEPRVPLISASQGFAVFQNIFRHVFLAVMFANNLERACVLPFVFKKAKTNSVARTYFYYLCALFNPPMSRLVDYSCVFCADGSSDFPRKKRRSI